MTLNDPSSISQEPQPPRGSNPPRTRRRRRGQLTVPADAEGRAALFQSLARRAYPSYELFVFAILCGAIIGLGFVIDSQAVLIFGILMAPLLTPWIGLLLGAITGSARFFGETLAALLISAALIFVSGVLAGFAARPFLPRTFNEAFLHSRLWWPDLIVLALGAIILTISFVRSENKPYLPSVMLAYEFFLPLSAGGFGLGSGVGDLWPQGVLVFLVYFAWATLFGFLTLIALRFMPTNFAGFAFSAGMIVIIAVILIGLMTGGSWIPSTGPRLGSQVATSTSSPLRTATETLPPIMDATPSLPPSSTPVIETETPTETLAPSPVPLTLEITLPPSETPTMTLTIEPTPVYARVLSDQGGGVNLRKQPGGQYIATLDNNSIVEVQPETQDVSGVTWAHVIAIRGTQSSTAGFCKAF
ncbi:MAG: hypothetical protein M1282_09520 [Chloroflexi bacterium]|nr:hypothetical protein [Chloroflexota bacterium]